MRALKPFLGPAITMRAWFAVMSAVARTELASPGSRVVYRMRIRASAVPSMTYPPAERSM